MAAFTFADFTALRIVRLPFGKSSPPLFVPSRDRASRSEADDVLVGGPRRPLEAGVERVPQTLAQAGPLLQDGHLLRRARQGAGRLGHARPAVEVLDAAAGELARRR